VHGNFEHIGKVIRQKYSADYQAMRARERRARILNWSIVVACIIVLVATPAAIYFLTNIQLLPAVTALAVALAAAFGPKIYADFIQPKTNAPATTE
jgi:hypothetical protein